ncbi:Dienelactone hydrolase [Colletotrichum higginsianum IMI 349063]|uniref:Dienelactone hydrolase n=3 Tax=Colletotrichum higginsianum TaxID=80884 RepID=A0A1B7Y9N0_COLHI|nr:Dienelactone hydrolase [Colletotrichum higginsianum IMI 349063]OBR08655.1 Dienelactone hydrolase [Colletotrichum higginsianum IMI 349063]
MSSSYAAKAARSGSQALSRLSPTPAVASRATPTATATPTTSAAPRSFATSCSSSRHSSPFAQQKHKSFSTQSANMSTMPAQHGHSVGCCNIPPVVSKGYEVKGTYEEIGGKKTYVTGPSDAKKAIVVVYDIFGYFPQTLQGADILATSGSEKYRVFIPDWFVGEPCPIEWFPPNTEEKQKNLGGFFQKFPPPNIASLVPDYVKAVQSKYSSLESFGVLGYCWGGKVVSLVTSGESNPFKVGAEIHPAMVEPEDAKGIKIPLILLASKDEPEEDVKKFEGNLSVAKHVETFKDQIHGWMAARSDLEDPRVKEEYTRGYKTVLEFFAKNF